MRRRCIGRRIYTGYVAAVNRRSKEEFKKVSWSGALTAASLFSEFEAKEELVERREVRGDKEKEETVDREKKRGIV